MKNMSLKMALVVIGTFLATSVQAAGLCDLTWDQLQSRLQQEENRLAFTNSGGPMSIGLCWWHSRMQRNANYSLDFQPQGRMNKAETWDVIKSLSGVGKVKAVKGFNNLNEFSGQYYNEMTETLGQWQLSDSFLKLGWTNGMGQQVKDKKTLSREMDALYKEVKAKKNVVYQMLKMDGFTAHAWLVIDMEKTAEGYNLMIIDSNYTSVQTYSYTRDMTGFYYYAMGSSFAPTTQRQGDLASFKSAIIKACKGKSKLGKN